MGPAVIAGIGSVSIKASADTHAYRAQLVMLHHRQAVLV